MRAAILAMLIVVGLAGCAEESGPITQDEALFEDIETEATATTGVIRGVVVDEAIVPVADANVQITNLGLETIADDQGRFAFNDLEPGSYFLTIGKVGYDSTQTSVEVVAGVEKPPIVRVMINTNPETLPLVEQFTFNGFIQCSTVTVVLRAAVCSFPGLVGIDLGDDFITYIPTPEMPDYIQTEMTWQSTQPTGDRLNLGNYGGSKSIVGSSPIVMKDNSTYWEKALIDGDPPSIAFRVFAGPMDGSDVGGTWGLGMALEQTFDLYTHYFYNTMPPSEDWMFINDGPPQ